MVALISENSEEKKGNAGDISTWARVQIPAARR
jgi:hypothetical protein